MNEVLFSVNEGVASITINRPGRSNALNAETLRELRSRLQNAGEDRSVRVITLTGSGDKVFCAGVDLKDSLAAGPDGQAVIRSRYRDLLIETAECPKPVVALVRGHVLGGGMGIVLAADLCLACDDVYFSTPEISVGMFPMMVLGLLYRSIGRKKATEMIFLGERIPAIQARELGLVNHVYPRSQLEKASRDLEARLTSKSPAIFSLGKRAISRILNERLAEEEKFLESALAEVMSTDDSREGIRAFIEQRPPKWS